MENMKKFLTNLSGQDSGQDLIEYALIAALIALGAVASMKGLGTAIGNTFGSVVALMTNATN